MERIANKYLEDVSAMAERQQLMESVTLLLLAVLVLGFLAFLGFLAYRMVRLQEQKHQEQKGPRGSATTFPDSKKPAPVQELDLDPDARYRPR